MKRYFIERGLTKVKIDEYMAKHFYRAGYVGVDIYKTPLGTRLVIYAERPAFIIGRRGQTIRTLGAFFERHFGLENPQLTIMPIENPDLNARVVAFRIVTALERGYHFRRVANAALKRIMAAGAVGAEITIAGKLTSERARHEKFRAGKIYKTGSQATLTTEKAVAHALLKPGIYGVKVVIVKPLKPEDYMALRAPEGASLSATEAEVSERETR
ncbi:MAG: 30S ribosomal protein S3 [Fervidicoccaceae archaeon]